MFYLACVVASWLAIVLSGAAGVEGSALPLFILRSIPTDHLVFSSPDAETWRLLETTTGIALFAAAAMLACQHARLRTWIAYSIVGVAAALALVTVGDVLRQWAATGYGGWFLLRYLRGERFSLHMVDLNAAGSLYVLAGLIAAALAAAQRRYRWLWTAAIVAMLPALGLSGSRTALLGVVLVGLGVSAAARQSRWRLSPAQAGAAAAAVIVIAVVGMALTGGRTEKPGSARMSLRLRSEFLKASARMFASAPLVGVGVGHYHERSGEFLSEEVRAIYPYENAHNYFVQQFAELGLPGGLAFVWLVVAGLRRGRLRAVQIGDADGVGLGLFAGTLGYLVTCVTGHPLLVPEAALPFWAAFGASTAAAENVSHRPLALQPGAVVAFTAVLLISITLRAGPGLRRDAMPSERGFHGMQTSDDGERYRWVTRHGVTHAGPDRGFLTVPVRAPAFPQRERPFVVEVAVDGRVVDRRAVPADRWEQIVVPLRDPASASFRRIDVWVNQEWTPKRAGLHQTDDRPMSVMVGEIRVEAVR
jgi:O-antigen ligase